MNGQVDLDADRESVWRALNDPEILKKCIPGCQELQKTDDEHFTARTKVAIGPIKATFSGNVELSEIDRPNGYRISGEGQGGIAGFAKAGARVQLADAEGGRTSLTYDVDAQIGGRIAQLGARLVNGVAKSYSDQFFSNLAKELNG
jgi:carbon monoxide dehydrogenase subunit G